MRFTAFTAFTARSAADKARKNVRSGRASRPEQRISTCVVASRRWMHRNQLEIGMYVSELDKPWEQTRFMFQGFRIESPEMLEAVRDACEYACVDSEKLARISSNSTHRLVGAGS